MDHRWGRRFPAAGLVMLFNLGLELGRDAESGIAPPPRNSCAHTSKTFPTSDEYFDAAAPSKLHEVGEFGPEAFMDARGGRRL